MLPLRLCWGSLSVAMSLIRHRPPRGWDRLQPALEAMPSREVGYFGDQPSSALAGPSLGVRADNPRHHRCGVAAEQHEAVFGNGFDAGAANHGRVPRMWGCSSTTTPIRPCIEALSNGAVDVVATDEIA
jgi:hypothetical protein